MTDATAGTPLLAYLGQIDPEALGRDDYSGPLAGYINPAARRRLRLHSQRGLLDFAALIAQAVFAEEGEVSPLFLVGGPRRSGDRDIRLIAANWSDPMEKHATLHALTATLRDSGAVRVAFLGKSWAARASADPAVAGLRVSQRSDRSEIVHVLCIERHKPPVGRWFDILRPADGGKPTLVEDTDPVDVGGGWLTTLLE